MPAPHRRRSDSKVGIAPRLFCKKLVYILQGG